MNTENGDKPKSWINQHPWLTFIIILLVTGLISNIINDNTKPLPAPSDTPTVATAQPTIQNISLTEAQCQSLKNELESVVVNQPVKKTEMGKELLEQYAQDAGMPVNMSNPNVRYILPNSKCGQNLDTLAKAIIQGAQ